MGNYGKAFSDFWSGRLRLDGTVPQTPFIVPNVRGGVTAPERAARDVLQGGLYLGLFSARQLHQF
ncbi:MAG: hypothetical protein HY720_11680 [Planctomycetes bacterium]|nr:hypothetical protein [Planctomycetota bacterium]